MTRLHGRGGSRSSTALLKRVLLSLLVVGLLGTVTGKRVYAVFVTESINTGSAASTGTFTIDVAIGSNSSCTSNGPFTAGVPSTANNNSCSGATGTLFDSTPRYPGDASTVAVAVRNSGSLDSQDLKVTLNCTNTNAGNAANQCTGLNNGGNSVYGGLELFIQETYANGVPITNGCLYPDANPDLPGIGTQYPVCAGPFWEPGSFVGFPTNTSCWDLGRIKAGATRYFTIGVQFPADSDAKWQGTSSAFSLKWHADSIDGSLSTASCIND